MKLLCSELIVVVSFTQKVLNSFRLPGFLAAHDLAPPPNPPTAYRQQVVSFSQTSCVSPLELLLTEELCEGMGKIQIIRQRESLSLYKSFITLWFLREG